MRKSVYLGGALAILGLISTSASAQASTATQLPPPAVEAGKSQLAYQVLTGPGHAILKVGSPQFGNLTDVPFKYTQYRDNQIPGLHWSKGPEGTRAYVVILQDGDGITPEHEPALHWTLLNVPANVTKLSAGITTLPEGASNGPDYWGPKHAYMGPQPPAGPRHRYHYQVFALDTVLPVEQTTTYKDLVAAIQGHVLARGQVIGYGKFDPSWKKPAG